MEIEQPERKNKGPFPLMKALIVLILVFSSVLAWSVYRRAQWQKAQDRRTTLGPVVFQPLPLGSVKPKGWLLGQLELQAGGLSGHLDEFWPDIKDSGWIGGKAEGWERAPYWLDGLVPLAYLTDDPRLKRKAARWMDYILRHQLADGWLGPENSPPPFGSHFQPPDPRDPWPQFVILKALTQYGEATGDERVVPAVQKSLACLDASLDRRPLWAWNYFRWGDLLVSAFWLYDRTGEPWLLDLARKAASEGYNWPQHFSDLPLKEKSKEWNWRGHVVNNAMGLKVPALLYRLTGEPRFEKLSRGALEQLDRWHGEANGLMSGDECLAGKSPSQGTELCAIVESMFSLENDLSILGDVLYADRVEKIAYNALPASCTPDYWCHQYVEQSNQVACWYVSDPVYATVSGAANLFGLEPNFGCCTANMHQGWPKMASRLWMRAADGGLAAVIYAPSVVETDVAGVRVRVELATDYPFSEELSFRVTADRPVEFPLYLRVPEWAEEATLRLPDGSVRSLERGKFAKVLRQWGGDETVLLRLPMKFKVREGYQGSASVERGPLVYSLGIKEDWRAVQPFKPQPPGKPRFDLAVLPASPWNYALELDRDHPERSLRFNAAPVKGDPFTPEGAPVRVSVMGKRLESWGMDKGAAMPPPQSPVLDGAALEELELVPYGSARLRVTEFPTLK